MKTTGLVIIACMVGVLVGGCDSTKELLGQGKRTPDEFAVYSRAPLSLPPDYGLRPPAPGAVRPHGLDPTSRARQAVYGSGGKPPVAVEVAATGSPGIKALMAETGALTAEPDIRTIVNRETTILAEEDQSVTERIMFWGTPTEYGSVVDAEKESRRIRENKALGRPLTDGETPTIERKRRALLEGIFN